MPGSGPGIVWAQNRQSAKLFLQSSERNWDSPTPLAAGECAPPPFGPRGRTHSLAGEELGSPNSDEGTYTVVLFISAGHAVPGTDEVFSADQFC
jgi:hypothetical protein